MPVTGRPPKSPAERKVSGRVSKRPLTTAVPPPPDGAMVCPDVVMTNPRARAYWDHTLSSVAPGHLAPVDAPLLARYCLALARADEAEIALAANGLVVAGPNTGFLVQSPWLAIVNRQSEMARKLAAELCLPPAQRNRVGVHRPRSDDPAAQYFDA
jgi:phage terminase small subunit